MDAELEAARERAMAAEPGETVEVEQPEAGETVSAEATDPGGAENDGAERAEPEAAAAEPAVSPSDDRIVKLERKLAEYEDQMTRLSGRDRVVDEKPPVDVDKIETKEDLAKYLQWQETKLRRELSASFRGEAMSAAAEQRARGLFTAKEMGQGRDYDTLTRTHLGEIEQRDPVFRRWLDSQEDPALTRYVTAAVLEVMNRSKGDPVRSVANLWAALDGKQTTTRSLMKEVRTAAEKEVGRSNLRTARGAEPRDKSATMGRDAKELSPSEFHEKYADLMARVG